MHRVRQDGDLRVKEPLNRLDGHAMFLALGTVSDIPIEARDRVEHELDIHLCVRFVKVRMS